MNHTYLIGNAHLDPVWLWRKTEGMSEIMSTFRSALDRMREFPDFVFCSACAAYYQWVERVDADMFEEIKARVAQGRWVIVGGYWIQPDCNLPCGEAFVRQALYSQRYFMEKFGKIARVGYNVDSFGHNGMMPQLLSKAGMDSYIFMRPDKNENDKIPNDVFVWKSPDGSSVTAVRIEGHYGDIDIPEELRKKHPPQHRAALKALLLHDDAKNRHISNLSFFGIGNHGGGPTIRGLQALQKVTAEYPDIVHGSVEQFFSDYLSAVAQDTLPTYSMDFQHHASGCYSAFSAIKAENRRAECELVGAEKLNTLSHCLTREAFRTQELKTAWQSLLFNQFHDILAGCCIKEGYTDALNELGGVRSAAADVMRLSAQRIAWRVRTTRILDELSAQKNGWLLWEKNGEGAPVVIFNPHSFPIREAVQVNVSISAVTDTQGKSIPYQNVRGPQTNNDDIYNALFFADVPAFGYSVYYLYKDASFPFHTAAVTAVEDYLENDFIRIRFSKETGGILSFFDKKQNRELAAAPMSCAVVIDDEASDTWAHGIFTFDKQIGSFSQAQIKVRETGPLRASLEITTLYGASKLVQTYSLYAGRCELYVACSLNLTETHKIIKLAFPVNVRNPKALYSMPYGFIAKKCNGEEEPSHQWAAITNASMGDGLALLNDSKYSFCAKDNELRMIVARSAIFADHFGKRDDQVNYQDMGEMEFSYALTPFSGQNLPEIVRQATVFNLGPHVVLDTHHDGPLEPIYSGISISAPNVICKTIKQAEDGTAFIARLYETSGRKTKVDVDFACMNVSMTLDFAPQEIKTIRILPGGSYHEIYMHELDIE